MIITAGKPVTGDQLIGREKEISLIGEYLETYFPWRQKLQHRCW